MRDSAVHVLVCMVALVAGCDDDLSCDVLAEPTNCWADAAARAAACLPSLPATGTLRSDRTGCDFSNGARVEFDEALPDDTMQLERLAFDVTGADCAWRFVDTFENRMELTVDGETEVAELHAGEDFHLHCSGGSTYAASFDSLFTCQSPARVPTDGFEVTPTSFTFTLSAVTIPSQIFTCTL